MVAPASPLDVRKAAGKALPLSPIEHSKQKKGFGVFARSSIFLEFTP
jgi:hypothetical protein